MENWQAFLWSVLGAGGGGAVVAYLAFKGLGESWLESKFAEKLEAFRHEKSVELARMRVEIDSSLDSVIRLQDKRFHAMSEAWTLLQEAFAASIAFVSPFQSYPEIRKYKDDELEELMNDYELPRIGKRMILESSERQKDFSDAVDRKRMADMSKAVNTFSKSVHLNAIFFLESELTELKDIASQLQGIWHDKSFEIRHGTGSARVDEKVEKAWDRLTGDINLRIVSIGKSFRINLNDRAS